jgi:hypothetical protein
MQICKLLNVVFESVDNWVKAVVVNMLAVVVDNDALYKLEVVREAWVQC